ncbi:hypothetical protein SNE40_008461 [Patella caerulea]|uniref:PH domain-containing protein n=1 Tax=Patella caerulea TaxID=87958 RepID=A0AAN8JVL7_PATCE
MSKERSPDYARNSQVINKYGTVKMKSKVFKIWTSRYLILCRDSQFGPACFVRYSSTKAFEANKIENKYLLEDIKVVRRKIDDRCGVVLLRYDNSRLEFKCKTAAEAESWIYPIESLLDSVRRNCDSTFVVTAFPCNVTKGERLNATLIVDRDGVSMISLHDNHQYFRWPYEVIKTYQNDETNIVSIEVGRSAETGTGVYRFLSDQAVVIVNKIQYMLRTRDMNGTTNPYITPVSGIGAYDYPTDAPSITKNPYLELSDGAPSGGYITAVHENPSNE